MTTWSKMRQIADELMCIANDAKEIEGMVMGNEKVRSEIACMINDIKEIIKLINSDGNPTDGRG